MWPASVRRPCLRSLPWASSATQASSPSCLTAIAGTYYRPSDFVITLMTDHSLVGQYSKATQDAIGIEESFSGRWACTASTITIQQFDFLASTRTTNVERGNAKGTFDANRTLSLTFTFHVFPESASAASLRKGTGSVVHVPTLQATRVSTP
jgi:hypothetical protein